MIELQLKHMTLQIELPEGVAADPKLIDGGHPLHYVLKMRKQTENYLNQVHELLSVVPPGLDVKELCAGIGLVAASNWEHLQPRTWTGIELDPNCQALFEKIAPKAEFMLKDMYDYLPVDLSQYLMICEFSNNTLPKMWREPQRAALLKRIAEAKPRYWYIADVGYYWIHLANHWPLYQERFGVKPTRDNYATLFDTFMRDNYGYTVTKWTVGGGAQYFLLEAV